MRAPRTARSFNPALVPGRVRRARALAIGCVAALALPTPAFPASNSNAKILIHLMAPTSKSACSAGAALSGCSALNAQGALYPAGPAPVPAT